MAVTIVAALAVPRLRVAVVAAGVAAVLRLARHACGPDLGHAVRRFDPAAQPRQLCQRARVLRQVRKANQLDLHRRVAIGLHAARRVAQRSRAFCGVDMLQDARRIDGEVRVRALFRKRGQRARGAAAFGGVVNDLERPADMRPRRAGDRVPDGERTACHGEPPLQQTGNCERGPAL